MKRLFTTFLVIIASGAGSLANEPSQKLLALSDQDRHKALADQVRRSGEECDVVIRSLLRHGAEGEPGFWNVSCRNQMSYWVIFTERGDRALVLNCEASKEFSEKLAEDARRAGQSPGPITECWK